MYTIGKRIQAVGQIVVSRERIPPNMVSEIMRRNLGMRRRGTSNCTALPHKSLYLFVTVRMLPIH
jgi:hypothetical protein